MSRWSLGVLATLILGLLAGCRTAPVASDDVLLPAWGSDSDELEAPPAGDVLKEEAAAAPTPTVSPDMPPAPVPRADVPSPPPPPPSAMPRADEPTSPGRVAAPPGTEPPEAPSVASVAIPRTASTACCPDPREKPWRGNYDWMTMSDRSARWPNAYFGLSGSFLPNLGASFTIGGIYLRTESTKWAWEIEATYQPFDDEIFADDGNPKAGDWWQIQAGVKLASAPHTRRHLTGRWGGVWCWSGKDPNIVEEKGNYFGAYAGIGYEADLTPCFTTGPELSVMLMWHEKGDFVVVPQFNWHFIWSF